ncbi:MAG TPA: hypothetical protein VFH38_07140 [Jatrophihabitans sp.]|nr:hypothetical protein [Jatrophihabitans sp.]
MTADTATAAAVPHVTEPHDLPYGAALATAAKRYRYIYTTGPFALPETARSIDWVVLNDDSTQQTVRVTVFKCPVGGPKTAEPPGPLDIAIAPGATTHNANNAVGGFIYEIRIEANSPLILPYATAWPGNISDPLAAATRTAAEFVQRLHY